MNWYRIATGKLGYFGQCDRVRRSKIGNELWENMISKHQKVSSEEFLNSCDTSRLLDEDETLDDFVADDSTSYFAKSVWGGQTCYYIMHNGFEFIFL